MFTFNIQVIPFKVNEELTGCYVNLSLHKYNKKFFDIFQKIS